MRLLITILTSVLLGVVGGTLSFQVYTFFSAEETKFQVSGSQPLLLVSNQEKLSEEGQDLTQETVVVEEITAESLPEPLAVEPTPTPTPEPEVELVYFVPTASPSASTSPEPSASNPATTSEKAIASPAPAGLSAEVLFSLVNQHRSSIGLPNFQKDDNLCAIAQSRAPELAGEFARGYLHAGFHARNLPYWASENVISQRSEQQALNWWLRSGVHRRAIQGDYSHSCVACSGYNCTQIFSSFTPKRAQISSI